MRSIELEEVFGARSHARGPVWLVVGGVVDGKRASVVERRPKLKVAETRFRVGLGFLFPIDGTTGYLSSSFLESSGCFLALLRRARSCCRPRRWWYVLFFSRVAAWSTQS